MGRIRFQRHVKAAPVSQASPPPEYEGPLDLVPGAVVAYGVRALSAAMLGQNIFRLRRDSDDAEMDFAADAVTGAAPAASIATFLAATTGFVVTWYDQSGNANHQTQADAAKQPQWQANMFGGVGSPVFAAAGNPGLYMVTQSNVTFPTDDYCCLFVARFTDDPDANQWPICGINYKQFAGDGEVFVVRLTNGEQLSYEASSDAQGETNAGGTAEAEAITFAANYAVSCSWTFGARAVTVNGSAVSTASSEEGFTAPGEVAGKLALGQVDESPGNDSGLNGLLPEMLLYASRPDAGNIALAIANQKTYYGIS